MIRISAENARFMSSVLTLTPHLMGILEMVPEEGASLSDDDADQLRDLCGERLQTHGFDDNYKPNEEGRKLESLIDRLFIG